MTDNLDMGKVGPVLAAFVVLVLSAILGYAWGASSAEIVDTGIWQLDNFMVTAKSNAGIWSAGYYEDEYIKEKGEWKIQRTRLTMVFSSDIEKGWAKERFSKVSGF